MAEQPEPVAEEDPRDTEPPTEVHNDPSALESEAQESVEPTIEEPEAHPAVPDRGGRIARWAKRRSIRQIKRDVAADARRPFPWDVRENADTRLPDGESVHLAGLVLLEAFPPSMIAGLDRSIRDLPDGAGIRKQDIRRHLALSRRGASHGSAHIGMVRHPGSFISDGWKDPDLPEPVDAVLLQVHYRTPSLAVVSAVFILKEAAGDLSSLIRKDAHVQGERVLELPGRMAWLRKRIPWSKPKNYRAYYSRITASGRKAELCEARMSEVQSQCHAWLAGRFQGLFAEYGVTRRPVARVLLTEEMAPFKPRLLQWRPVILGEMFDIWRSDDPGWSLNITWPSGTEQNIMTFAARRRDVEVEHVQPGTEQSNWSIMQSFEDGYLALIMRYELVPLLATYSETLSLLRDRAGARRRFRRPVKEARTLDEFMVRDGLDAASIARDIHSQTREVRDFKLELATFTEDLSEYPESYREKREAASFSEQLFEQLRHLISELTADTEVVTANIRASADLRQAIANTRLQRAAVVLSICALIAAIVSVVISLHPH